MKVTNGPNTHHKHTSSSPSFIHFHDFSTSSYLPSSSSPHFLPLMVMFDPRKQTPNDNWEPLNFGFQVSKKHGNWTKNDGGAGIQFKVQEMKEHEDGGIESGASSPPLWQNSPPISPVHHSINYRSLPPSSRAQAIARGQWELMEMVKNMPESCYELSLKDLVEQPTIATQENCLISKEKNQELQHRVKIKRQGNSNMNKKNDQIKKAKMMRSKSFDNGGLFLKMVSPVPLRSKRKKKNSANTTNKVSPKPEECENSSKSLEKDWWKKRFSSLSESGSSRTSRNRNSDSSSSSSTNSRNNSNRKRKGFLSSCWLRLCFSKSISAG